MSIAQQTQQIDHAEENVGGPRGLQVFRQRWLPKLDIEQQNKQLKALIIVVHGLAEHSGRYQHIAHDLCQQQYGVYSLDHIGHGKSEGRRCTVKSFADYVLPLKKLVEDVKQRHPQRPVFLLGHSMGGLISCEYLLNHQDDVAGAILSAPAVLSFNNPNILTLLKLFFFAVFAPNKGFLALDAKGVSRNPAVVSAYLEDPLVYKGLLPVNFLMAMSKTMQGVRKQASRLKLPLLILQGDQDTMVNPSGTQSLFDDATSKDKELERYPDCYHEILNEEEYPQICQGILAWLDRQAQAPV